MIYPLLPGLGRPQLWLQTRHFEGLFCINEFRWEHPTHPTPKLWLKAAFNPKRLQLSQKEGEKKHPPNLRKVKHIPPGKDRWRSPLPGWKIMVPYFLPPNSGVMPKSHLHHLLSLRCSSFMAVQVMLRGFPYYTERNSCLVRVECLGTTQFHVSRFRFLQPL